MSIGMQLAIVFGSWGLSVLIVYLYIFNND